MIALHNTSARHPLDRRGFLRAAAGAGVGLAGIALLPGCRESRAITTSPRVYRVGWLSREAAEDGPPLVGLRPYLHGVMFGRLQELGYIEGQNLEVQYHYTDGVHERAAVLAGDLERAGVDAIIAETFPMAWWARLGAHTVPVVFIIEGDPTVALVKSLARPGHNLTGITYDNLGAIMGKRLDLLKIAFPAIRRVALFFDRGIGFGSWETIAQQSATLGLELQQFAVSSDTDLDRALDLVAAEPPDAAILVTSARILLGWQRIFAWVQQRNLPTMLDFGGWVTHGPALMAYGAAEEPMWRRLAEFLDKVLKGARPADLPVERPTHFDFVINLKTAKALGLTIAPSALAQATRVIQ